MAFRVGIGRDFHRLVTGRPLILCGVRVCDAFGCLAHSDGDCAVHALMDALLGAAAQPNIGVLFPNEEPKNRGRSSLGMLREVVERLDVLGFRVANVDISISLEEPKLAPHTAAMGENLARILGISPQRVGIKATSAEGMGEIGKGLAMEALSVCLLEEGGENGGIQWVSSGVSSAPQN
jgi:2-C-methyl-D-erythritol 2,4-cyclodiphosphate synthase